MADSTGSTGSTGAPEDVKELVVSAFETMLKEYTAQGTI